MFKWNYCRVLIALCLGLLGVSARGQQCDCQQVVGQCIGAIEFVKGFGSVPSFGAEIIIHSSEKRCSKVEYYLDSTPHQTILVNKQKEPESLFGTSPITSANVTFNACHICTVVGEAQADKQDRPSAEQVVSSPFDGIWVGTLRWFIASDPMELHVKSTGGQLSGHMVNKSGTFPFRAPSISGDVLKWSYVGTDGVLGNATLTKTGPDTAAAVFNAGAGVAFKGELRRNQ